MAKDDNATTIARLEAERDHFQKLAYTDELTGLPNSRAIREFATEHPGGSWVVADLNRFKEYQDNKGGHAAGDAVLKGFAKFLVANTRQCPCAECGNGHLRPSDVIAARLHGDEFAVYVRGTSSINGADRIALAIADNWKYDTVTATAGVGNTESSADRCLYKLKECIRDLY